MARSSGIPTRVTTGYVFGEYYPFTGLYEAKASDAHAWVEVYFPGHGCSTFDPTPWQYEAAGNIQGGKVFRFLAEKTGDALSPDPLGHRNARARRRPPGSGERNPSGCPFQQCSAARHSVAAIPDPPMARSLSAAFHKSLGHQDLQPV